MTRVTAITDRTRMTGMTNAAGITRITKFNFYSEGLSVFAPFRHLRIWVG